METRRRQSELGAEKSPERPIWTVDLQNGKRIRKKSNKNPFCRIWMEERK
jgi:hypothetical protein